MLILRRMLKQLAVWWPRTGVDAYGKPEFGAPTEIRVRWEDANEEFLNAKAERVLSQAVVYTDRDIRAGDLLSLGFLVSDEWILAQGIWNDGGIWIDTEEWIDTLDGVGTLAAAKEVMRFDKLPTLRGTKFLRTAYL